MTATADLTACLMAFLGIGGIILGLGPNTTPPCRHTETLLSLPRSAGALLLPEFLAASADLRPCSWCRRCLPPCWSGSSSRPRKGGRVSRLELVQEFLLRSYLGDTSFLCSKQSYPSSSCDLDAFRWPQPGFTGTRHSAVHHDYIVLMPTTFRFFRTATSFALYVRPSSCP